jgi:hypothetical protein
MATKKKKAPARPTTDYGKAKELAENMLLLKEVYLTDIDNKDYFRKYLIIAGKERQKRFATRDTEKGLQVIRIA